VKKKKISQIRSSVDKEKAVVLFDGFCNLCSWSVQFIIKRDKKDYFRFASLQSEIASQFFKDYNIPKGFYQSIVLIENNAVYFKSDAALRIAHKLKGLWPVLYSFKITPKAFRDYIYTIIAKNRFKWFGKKEICYVPNEKYLVKFL